MYCWKSGSRISGIDPNVAGNVMHGLSESEIGLNPKTLLDASRDADAPLHSAFEWNDAKAAEGYRENQAGHLIRSIEIKIEHHEAPVRAFAPIFLDYEDTARTYKHVNFIMQNEEYERQMLEEAVSELRAFANKYRSLASLIGAINPILDKFALDIIQRNNVEF